MSARAKPALSGADYQALQAKAMSEEDLTKSVLDLCDLTGWTARHHIRDSRSAQKAGKHSRGIILDTGLPDWIFANPTQERLVWIEFKNQKAEPTYKQVGWGVMLEICHQEYYLWRPSDWFNGTIERVLRGCHER